MSSISGMNKSLNAVIALIEGRVDIAKEIIREPDSDVENVPEVLARLDRAVNKTVAKAMRNVLVRSLSVQPPSDSISDSITRSVIAEAFYLGVTEVEKIFEKAIEELEG